MADFDGGAGGSPDGGDHDGYGHSCEGGVEGGGGGADGGFTLGNLASALACMGFMEGSEDGSHSGFGASADCQRRVKLPGTVFGKSSSQVLIWPHGPFDVNAVLSSVVARHGFRDINFKKPECAPTTKVDGTIRDTTPFDGPNYNAPMPSGYLPGGTGFTRMHTNYWQLPTKGTLFSMPRLDLKAAVHLTVTSCTWFFNEPGDFETRVVLSVFSRQTLVDGEWRRPEELVKRYVARLPHLAADIFQTLSQYRSTPHSLLLRQLHQDASAALAQQTVMVEPPPRVGSGASAPALHIPGAGGMASGPDPMSFDHSV